jgi:D-3-phosphoglycerate dehydrogenase
MKWSTYIIYPNFGKNSKAIDILREVTDIEIRKESERPSVNEIKKFAMDFDGILIGTREKINRNTIPDNAKLKVVGILAKAVDNIDDSFCSQKSIKYTNCPGSNNRAVAEFIFAQALFMYKNLEKAQIALRKNDWGWRMKLQTMELQNKTLGIIGAGEIGVEVIKIAKIFEMKIICHTLNPNKHSNLEREYGVKFVKLDYLLREANIITITIPYSKETDSLIGKEQVNSMKPDAIFINAARGRIVDENALIDALKNKKIGGACIDVFKDEPNINEKFFSLPNVLLTPHIAGLTSEAWNRMEEIVARGMVKCFRAI